MHRRQVWLFVLVVLLPCAILVALGVRMLAQERELTGKRVAADQQRVAEDAQREMLRRIGELPAQNWQEQALNEARILAFRGKLAPWDSNRDTQLAGQLLRRSALVEALDAGDFPGALAAARHPAQRAYVRLKMAAGLAEAGRTSEAYRIDLELLRLPGLLVDGAGVPFRVRAASQLAAAGVMQQAVSDMLIEELASSRPMAPSEIVLAKQIAQRLAKHQPSAGEGGRLIDKLSIGCRVPLNSVL